MKRSEMVERIYDLLNCDGVLEHSMPKLEPIPLTEEHVRWVAEQIVKEIEQSNMFYCPVADLGELGKLRLLEGWEPEDEKK
jgi:hypothetical protein